MSIYRDYNEIEKTRGCVVKEWEHNGYDDSDFYAIIYNPDTDQFETVEWGTTRFASIGHGDDCVVDATDEIMEKYEQYVADLKAKAKVKSEKIEAATPRVGKTVRSLTTRGKAFQKSGIVFWIGPNRFRTYYRHGYNHPENNMVVGFKTEYGESVFVPMEKLEVI